MLRNYLRKWLGINDNSVLLRKIVKEELNNELFDIKTSVYDEQVNLSITQEHQASFLRELIKHLDIKYDEYENKITKRRRKKK